MYLTKRSSASRFVRPPQPCVWACVCARMCVYIVCVCVSSARPPPPGMCFLWVWTSCECAPPCAHTIHARTHAHARTPCTWGRGSYSSSCPRCCRWFPEILRSSQKSLPWYFTTYSNIYIIYGRGGGFLEFSGVLKSDCPGILLHLALHYTHTYVQERRWFPGILRISHKTWPWYWTRKTLYYTDFWEFVCYFWEPMWLLRVCAGFLQFSHVTVSVMNLKMSSCTFLSYIYIHVCVCVCVCTHILYICICIYVCIRRK